MKAGGWEKFADMGTHTHRFANEHGVECNMGLDAHNPDGAKLELEIVDSEQDISVLLSVEPSPSAMESAIAILVRHLPEVTAMNVQAPSHPSTLSV